MSGTTEVRMRESQEEVQRSEARAGGEREVRWSARRKEGVVLRLLRGESLDALVVTYPRPAGYQRVSLRVMRSWMVALVALFAAAALTACGHAGGPRHGAATTARRPAVELSSLTPAQRREVLARQRAQRPHFSSRQVMARIALLNGAARRSALIRALRRAVRADARRRIIDRQLKGPLRGVSCTVARDDTKFAAAHPEARILRYSCIAISFRSTTSPPMIIGTPFIARVDFAAPRFVWCLFTPVGGEGTHTALTFAVPPSPQCAGNPQA